MGSNKLLVLAGTIIGVFAANYFASHLFGEVLAGKSFIWLQIDPVFNTGLALSLHISSLLNIVLPLLTLGVLIWILVKQTPVTLIEMIAFGLILGAGIANLSERLTTGGVLDYFRIANLPTVNLADILLTIGIVIYLWKNLGHEN